MSTVTGRRWRRRRDGAPQDFFLSIVSVRARRGASVNDARHLTWGRRGGRIAMMTTSNASPPTAKDRDDCGLDTVTYGGLWHVKITAPSLNIVIAFLIKPFNTPSLT
jgi:hypothetical protein